MQSLQGQTNPKTIFIILFPPYLLPHSIQQLISNLRYSVQTYTYLVTHKLEIKVIAKHQFPSFILTLKHETNTNRKTLITIIISCFKNTANQKPKKALLFLRFLTVSIPPGSPLLVSKSQMSVNDIQENFATISNWIHHACGSLANKLHFLVICFLSTQEKIRYDLLYF